MFTGLFLAILGMGPYFKIGKFYPTFLPNWEITQKLTRLCQSFLVLNVSPSPQPYSWTVFIQWNK